MLLPIRFRIRTLLLLITFVAAWIAWQHRSPDAKAIAAIKERGGIVHLNGHHPEFDLNYVSFLIPPDHVYCGHPDVTHAHRAQSKSLRQSAWDLFIGTRDNRVRMVEISLNEMTPSIIAHLQSLDDLSTIILDMPQPIFPKDSKLGSRLADLQSTFQNRIVPRRGRFFSSELQIDS